MRLQALLFSNAAVTTSSTQLKIDISPGCPQETREYNDRQDGSLTETFCAEEA